MSKTVTLVVITTLKTLAIATLQNNYIFNYSINQVVITNSNNTDIGHNETTINILPTLKTLSSSPI